MIPGFFDPFAGGGSIPLEANRLGFQVHAADLNPVAVLLNKCNLELAARWLGQPPINSSDRERIGGGEGWRGTDGLASDLRYYAGVINDRAKATIGELYPKVKVPKKYGGGESNAIAWIWARTVSSPDPAAHGRHVPLLSTFMLSTKPGKMAWISTDLDESAPDGWLSLVDSGELRKDKLEKARLGTKAGKAQDFVCLLKGTPVQRSYVQAEGKAGRLGRRLVAIVVDAPSGKLFLPPDAEQEAIGKFTDSRVEDARSTFLAGSLPTRAEITGGVCTAYGLSTWGHLFWPRQIVALLTLSDLVKEVITDVSRDATAAGLTADEVEAYARTVTTFLALAVDRCADFNNSLCRWSASNQKVMNLFARQALPMVFDSAEANVLGDSVGAWSTCSAYVADCVRVIKPMRADGATRVFQTDAAAGTDWPSRLLVSTDPPYYHNISYATLSDFFYVWLRRVVGGIYPDLFRTVLTPKVPELIASPDRFGGSRELAKQHFESGFRDAFTALRDRMDPRYPLTVTESAKLAKNCLLVISLPASDTAISPHIQANDEEVGGERGRVALARLQHVIGRLESSWTPATAEESFEIVRRRLFEPMVNPDSFKQRDVVAREFYDLYRTQHQEFPPESRDAEYERRLKEAYPIHPEVFDRLYTDWSTLVKFQRTRGVLRLMAAVIHSLWEKGDRNPLILPGNIPIDDQRVRDELTRYLPVTWKPVIEKDVDGPNSLPFRLDGEIPNLGKFHACRRVARTIYLGSAPTETAAHRGIEDRRVKLGCVMPGESPAVFGDALRRLAGTATYLYQDGPRVWYSTQPTVTKLADDRAEQLKRDPDKVVQELDRRLRADLRTVGDFSRIHALAQRMPRTAAPAVRSSSLAMDSFCLMPEAPVEYCLVTAASSSRTRQFTPKSRQAWSHDSAPANARTPDPRKAEGSPTPKRRVGRCSAGYARTRAGAGNGG
jgi:hypothetical protein